MPRARPVTVEPPSELGRRDGLAYALYLPPGPAAGSVLILHGAGSCKESHLGFARNARAHGFAALAFDLRGHGDSEGELGAGVMADLATMAALLPSGVPLALRGSSMGGYLAVVAARELGARAVVAICPAGADHLLRGLRGRQGMPFRCDPAGFEAFLAAHDAMRAAAELEAGLLVLHAEGDAVIPVAHSAALYRTAARARPRRLIAVPGGHHRSVQHDGELQGEALRWLERALAAG